MRKTFSIFFLCACSFAHAQLTVTANGSATALAGLLAGPGVTISGATMNCAAGASGTFNGAASNIGLSNGVLLTTGSVAIAPGPNNSSMAGQNNGVIFSDPQLIAIDPTAYYDPCILEFNAVPTCTTMSFSFVFGSEEYHDYVNTACNDAFGIFITGANPSGPAYANYNMALVPFTATPISINNVNNGNSLACNAAGPCTNCAYFVDNCGGATVQYDGFTTSITVNLNVVACATYHLKLAIGDACDGIYDSGVFFKSNSLTCNITPLTATTSSSPSVCSANNGTATVNPTGGTPPYTYSWSPGGQTNATATGLASGNYTATITDATGCFSTTATVTVAGSGSLVLSATHTNATCFGGSNGSATASITSGNPAYTFVWSNGQTTSTATGLIAGNYSVVVTDGTGCSSTLNYTITQPTAVTATTTSTPEICNQLNGTATVSSSGGTGAHTYLWSNGQTTSAAAGLGSGSYSVTVTDASGCTFAASVTVGQTGGPTALAGSDVSYCAGNTTQLNAGGGGNYSWVPSTALSNSTISNPVASPTSSTTYTVIVTDVNGCTSADDVTVTVNPLPVTNAGSDRSVCSGFSATLNGSGGGNYSWTPSTSLSSSVISNPVSSPVSSTTYTLTVTDANSCSSSDVVTVTVNPRPNATFSVTTVCFNNPTVFTDLSSGGNIVQWHWDFGDGNSDSVQNPSHTYNNSGSYIVILVVTTAEGCVDTAGQQVNVNPLPVVSFTSTSVCVGSQTCFTDATTISSGTTTAWSWNFGDPLSGLNNISNQQYPCHVYTDTGSYSVFLTVTSNFGCQGTSMLSAIVLPPPVAAFTAPDVCLNTPTVFTDGSSSATNWYWQFGDGGTSAQQNPSHTYLGYGSYVVTLIVSSTGSCADTITDTVKVSPVPVVNFVADTVCLGDSTFFFDLSFLSAGTITGWLWNFGDGNTSAQQNPVHVYSSAGSYIVTLSVSSSNNCTTTVSQTVPVHSLPLADFSFTPSPIAQLIEPVDFTDLSTGGVVSWAWNFGDGDSSFVQLPTHVYSDTGTYVITLIATSQYGCKDTVRYPLEIREFTFYIPNTFTPNGDGSNDLFFGVGLGITEYELSIFDRWGNLLFYCKVNDLPQSLPCLWDGKVKGGMNETVQQDVYVYKIRFSNIFKKQYNLIGNVNVVR